MDRLNFFNRVFPLLWNRAVVGDLLDSREAERSRAAEKLLNDSTDRRRDRSTRVCTVSIAGDQMALVVATNC